MTRHIIDIANGPTRSHMAAEFMRIDKASVPSAASRELQKRPKLTGSGRLRKFLRIERGRKA